MWYVLTHCCHAEYVVVNFSAKHPLVPQKALDLGSDLLEEDDENVELW